MVIYLYMDTTSQDIKKYTHIRNWPEDLFVTSGCRIVLRNPKPIPSWCDPFYAVFLSYIPESVQLLFTLTGAILVCACTAQKRSLHRERPSVRNTQPIWSRMLIFLWRQFRGRLAAGLHMCDGYLPWASCQIRKIADCACAGNAGNVFPTTAE